jgi:hypothetical protein
MKVERHADGRVSIEVPLDRGNRLASAIIKQAEDLPSAALDLANLLREANYAAHNDFRQPPDPWDPADEVPPSV